jgi:hypothetical protein
MTYQQSIEALRKKNQSSHPMKNHHKVNLHLLMPKWIIPLQYEEI